MLKAKKLTKSYDTAIEAYHKFGAISLYLERAPITVSTIY